ncbi:Fc.00g101050.m01.CDS01 [Cosmosporella sp. VM-42]
MLSQIQGRVNRRYVVIFVFACLSLFLWISFSPSFPKSTTVGSIEYVPSSYDWSKNEVFFPVTDMKSPPAGTPQTFPPLQAKSKEDGHSRARKAAVKKAFVKSWEAYKTHAWGQDELMPLSGKGKQSLSGWSAQLVDAMDTLWIMDLKEDFQKTVEEVARIDWSRTSDKFLNLFEVTIRHLGGLVAAYDLSGQEIILNKAIELGDMLYATFDTPNRLPSHWLYFDKAKSGKQQADESMSGAAGGSLCLEFTRLSQITGDPKYYDATERIKQFFYKNQNSTRIPGLWPHLMNYREETMDTAQFTLGAGADSQYEYLPKMHALLGGLDPEYEQMTTEALLTAKDTLLYRPMTRKDDNILMAGNAAMHKGHQIELSAEMQHLTCFAGGMYALAGKLLKRDDFVDIGSRLTAGCVFGYDSFPTNIMPEISQLVPCEKLDGPCPYDETKISKHQSDLPDGFARVRDPRYLLRPEAIESVFYMWRITGDQEWREAAWRMWEGIAKEAETEMAFAAVGDVRHHASTQADSMETFWLGETTKYFYLIFDDDNVINLDDWVLNTEAHPLKRPGRK